MSNAELLALHRYFIWAERMRSRFYSCLSTATPDALGDPNFYLAQDFGMFMAYWYATLYVLGEGWHELGLSDPRVSGLLGSENLHLLKRFRNGVFHYQRNYHDDRFMELIVQGRDVVSWVSELHDALGAFFLAAMKPPPPGAPGHDATDAGAPHPAGSESA